jgi:hypothetical protein
VSTNRDRKADLLILEDVLEARRQREMETLPFVRWIERKVSWLILWTPIGRIEWVVNLHYRYLFGHWPWTDKR